MAKKSVYFTKSGISRIPNDKSILYKILTNSDTNNYTGVAKRGRAQDRLREHLFLADTTNRIINPPITQNIFDKLSLKHRTSAREIYKESIKKRNGLVSAEPQFEVDRVRESISATSSELHQNPVLCILACSD